MSGAANPIARPPAPWRCCRAARQRRLGLGVAKGHHRSKTRGRAGHLRPTRQEYAAQREHAQRKPGDGRVPYYRLVLLGNGRLLTRLAVNAYGSRTITGTELSRILNAKLDHLPRIKEALVSQVIARGGALTRVP